MKKYLIVTLLVGAAALAAGCGQNTGPTGTSATEETHSESIVGDKAEGSRSEGMAPPPTSDSAAAAVDEEELPAPAATLPPRVYADGDMDVTPTVTQPALAGLRFPGLRYLFLSPSALDVSFLMNGDFQPDAFTTRETEIQSRITAARQAAGRAFDASGVFLEVRSEETFKQFVITALQTLIRTERDNETEFRNNIDQLGRFLQTLKTDDGTRANSVLEGGGLMNEDLWIEIGNYELNRGYVGYIGGIEKLGIYLELQFAEAFKDIAKASRNSRQEVLTQSTLIDGGDRLGLVYKPDGFLDQGWNHIRGLSNADLWYEGSANWARVADALRSALR